MYTKRENSFPAKRQESRAVANTATPKENSGQQGCGFINNHDKVITQQKIQQSPNIFQFQQKTHGKENNSNLSEHTFQGKLADSEPKAVLQLNKTGASVGALVGGGLGALGFFAGPLVGSITTLAGAAIGSAVGNFLSGQQVSISENEIKTAGKRDTILYPGLSSCMSITCILQDGSKVGGHAAQFGQSGVNFTNRIRNSIGAGVVTRVIAKGHGGSWGPHLESQIDLTPVATNIWRRTHPINPTDFQLVGVMQPLMASQNANQFENWLQGQFHALAVQFIDMENDGNVGINADGTVA
jgi:hypothetical protein